MPKLNCKIRFPSFEQDLYSDVESSDLFLYKTRKEEVLFEYGVGLIESVTMVNDIVEIVANTDEILISNVFSGDTTYWYRVDKRSTNFEILGDASYLNTANFLYFEDNHPVVITWKYSASRHVTIEEIPNPLFIDNSVFPAGEITSPFIQTHGMEISPYESMVSIRIKSQSLPRVKTKGSKFYIRVSGDEITSSRAMFTINGKITDTRSVFSNMSTHLERIVIDDRGIGYTSLRYLLSLHDDLLLVNDLQTDSISGMFITGHAAGSSILAKYKRATNSNSAIIHKAGYKYVSYRNGSIVLGDTDDQDVLCKIYVAPSYEVEGSAITQTAKYNIVNEMPSLPILFGESCLEMEAIPTTGQISIPGIMKDGLVQFDLTDFKHDGNILFLEDYTGAGATFLSRFKLDKEFGKISSTTSSIISSVSVYSTTNMTDIVDITDDVTAILHNNTLILVEAPALTNIGIGLHGLLPQAWVRT